MGQSHFKSNIVGFAGTEYIASIANIKSLTGMSVTSLDVTTATIAGLNTTSLNVTTGTIATLKSTTASANYVKASGLGDSSYMQIGVSQYLFVGNSNTSATVIAEATALVSTPIKGSLYLSRKGAAYIIKTDALASRIAFDA